MSTMGRTTSVRFADFEADLATCELRKHGFRVRLQEKPFQVLAAMLERPGELVTREELRNRLWGPDTFVDFDNNLNTAVYKLREALGDTSETPRFIETLSRKGYRFIGGVSDAAPAAIPARPPAVRGWRIPLAGAILLAVLGIASYVAFTSKTTQALASSQVPSAREAFLKGRYLLQKGGGGNVAQSIGFFEEAIAQDPEFAEAHSSLADALSYLPLKSPESVIRARSEAQKAIALKPDLAEAHLRLAMIALYDEWNWEGARVSFERAVSSGPDSAQLHHSYAGYFSLLGEHERAMAEIHKAIELDPVSVAINADAGWYWFVARRYDQAIAQSRKALELEPDHRGAHFYVLLSLIAKKDFAEARRWASKYLALGNDQKYLERVAAGDPESGLREFWRIRLEGALARVEREPLVVSEAALAYAALGENEKAITAMEELYRLRTGWLLPFMRVYPPLDPLRTNPRFSALQEKMKFPPR